MQLMSTRERYGAMAQLLHWLIVALIVMQYIVMESAHDLPAGLEKLKLYNLHKSVGITVLGLAVLRLVWRWINPTPAAPPGARGYELALAKLTHIALYVLIFAIPLSGWIMSNAENFPVRYFGWFTLPNLVAPDRELGESTEEVHEVLFNILVGITALHILAALRHHFWLKNDVLKRMLPFTRKQSPNP